MYVLIECRKEGLKSTMAILAALNKKGFKQDAIYGIVVSPNTNIFTVKGEVDDDQFEELEKIPGVLAVLIRLDPPHK